MSPLPPPQPPHELQVGSPAFNVDPELMLNSVYEYGGAPSKRGLNPHSNQGHPHINKQGFVNQGSTLHSFHCFAELWCQVLLGQKTTLPTDLQHSLEKLVANQTYPLLNFPTREAIARIEGIERMAGQLASSPI